MNIVPLEPNGLQQALDVLRSGGIVAHATETCYGLACDATNQAAVEQLFFIKKRPVSQLVTVLVGSVEQAKSCIEWNNTIDQLTKEHWPGALSIIGHLVRQSGVYASPIVSDSLSVRWSSHPTAQALVAGLGKPIVSSSANLSGGNELYSADAVHEEFEDQLNQPSLLLDEGQLALNPPSTIVDCRDDLKVIRQGSVRIKSANLE